MYLKTYPANKGDAFLVRWKYNDDEHQMLIDMGIEGTYRFIKNDLRVDNKLDAILITHIDYDHIGGLIKFLKDRDLKLVKTPDIYMNTPQLALAPSFDDKVGFGHGILVEDLMGKNGLIAKPLYLGLLDNNSLFLHGLEIKLLCPDQVVVDRLMEEWNASRILEQHRIDTTLSDKVGRSVEDLPSYDEIIMKKEKVMLWQDDLINSSSLAFTLKYNGCAILFLGDANPQLVFDQLSKDGWSKENKLKIDLVKISHHGSKHNSTKDLFSILDCNSYLISTDGTGPYYHPHRETIIKLAEYGRSSRDTKINLFLNYELDLTETLTAEEEKEWNISIQFKTEFNFKNCPCYQKI